VVGIVTNSDLVERGGLALRIELLRTLSPRELADQLAATETGKTVADVMTQPVSTVAPDATLTDTAHRMVTRRLKRLPVVDEGGRLLGMVSRVDLLRTTADFHARPTAEAAPAAGRTVGEVMRRDVPTVRRDAPLTDVLDAVVSTRLNQALVVDESNHVVGAVTDAELVRRLSPKDHPGVVRILMSKLPFASLSAEDRREIERARGLTAESLMIPSAPTVGPNTPIGEAIALMLGERRKILPVVDEMGRLLGAVDRADLLRILAPPRAGQVAE
jgi:CBS domain-containing protein